jgi:uncharacterized protein YhbP (UPF0306 family)
LLIRHQVSPDQLKLRELAQILISEQRGMTLATARESDAWAAHVYYVYLRSCFYFFSDPASRHIEESLASGGAAGVITAASTSWRDIRGIQMTGTIEAVSLGRETVEVLRAYLKKFPFAAEFFEGSQKIDTSSFFDRFRVKLYRFAPGMVYYLDNSIRFGFREKVSL